LRSPRAQRCGDQIAGGAAIAAVAPHLVKRLVDRERPDRKVVHLRRHGIPRSRQRWDSFPSGHAVHLGALAGALTRFVPPHYRPLVWPSAISLSATRVLLLAHYPSDVAAGLLLGALIDRLVARLARSMRIPTAVPNHRGSACASLPMSAHGSGVPASRRGTPAMVKAAGSRAGETSSQASGVATGAPGRARVE